MGVQRGEVGFFNFIAVLANFHGEIQHGALPRRDVGLAVIHSDLIRHQGFLFVNAQNGTVRDHAVQAVVGGAGGGDNHLAVALAQARVLFEHQRVVVGKKGPPFGRAPRQGQKDIGHKAGFFLDFQHLGADVVGQIFDFWGRVASGHEVTLDFLNLTSASHVAIFGRADGFKNVVSFSLFILQSLEPLVNKIYPSAAAALKGIVADGQLMAVGGFGLCGIPEALIDALRDSAVKNLTVISNNAGVDGFGLGILLETRQITKMISSYVGENKEFERQFLAGELALEFTPQGTLAEKLRAGGAGIPAFFTKTGVGTVVADGKELREFDGETYVMERALVPEVSLVKAFRADKSGNLQFRFTARNFNPAVAMAGKICVVEVEEIVETGAMHPDEIHLPGIYVHRIVHNPSPQKRIEKRTITEKAGV